MLDYMTVITEMKPAQGVSGSKGDAFLCSLVITSQYDV